MDSMLFYPAGTTRACAYAATELSHMGYAVTDHPQPEITHVLLDVPSFGPGGALRGGGSAEALLERLPETVTVIGGKLEHPALEGYATLDLLQDAAYLAENAAITADCALRAAGKELAGTFRDSPALVIGWGRIGKCLAKDLKALGCPVTVAARKETDRAMLEALGYPAADPTGLEAVLSQCRVIFNTAPEMVLPRELTALCREAVLIDLASKPGIEGEHVIWARGLPGIYAPKSSGALIAKRIMTLCEEGLT